MHCLSRQPRHGRGMQDRSYTNPNRDGVASAFTATPPAKLNSWNPKNITWEETPEVTRLMERAAYFKQKGVTLVDVMYVALISHEVQPLQV